MLAQMKGHLTAQLYLTIVSPYDGEMMAPNGRVVGLCHLKTWVGGVWDSVGQQ